MSEMPPEQPAAPPPPPPLYSGLGQSPVTGAILPVPGYAELAVFSTILVFLIVLWAVTDDVNASLFAILMTILTSVYILSRGIAKASRVLEQ